MLFRQSFQALNAEIIEFLFATTEPSTEQKTTRHRRITRLTFGTHLRIQFEAAVCDEWQMLQQRDAARLLLESDRPASEAIVLVHVWIALSCHSPKTTLSLEW